MILLGCADRGMAKDRPAYNAGVFYPKDPDEIRQTIGQYLHQAEVPSPNRKPFGIICPHAGYPYSGPVAAYSYKAVEHYQYDAAVVISPCHIDYFEFASIYDGDAYETPLGSMKVDKKLANQLVSDNKDVRFSSRGHGIGMNGRAEHSLEIQLPFIRITLGDLPIVPIVLGTMNRDVIRTLGQQLSNVAKSNNILIIASSDLSHYHSYSDCKKIDQKFINTLQDFSVDELYSKLTAGTVEACGGGPILAMLIAARQNNADEVGILHYANSGDVPFGDRSRVVGYLSAAFYKNSNKKDMTMKSADNRNRYLNKDEQTFLLQLAEDVIDACVQGKAIPEPENIPAICKEERGAFVTITKHGQLRGCIGYILPVYPLYKTVIEVAQSAALSDPRFNPVKSKELKDLEVEVSVLTVPHKIDDPSVIEVGKHGIIIKRGFYQGLLLPQVATEYGWDRETFLEHTCQKAGLPSNAWKDKNTEISIFSAQVFNRETLK